MPPVALTLTAALLLLSSLGYVLGRQRALALAGGSNRRLASRPGYHGLYLALWCGVPSLLVVALWAIAQPWLADWLLSALLPKEADSLDPGARALLALRVENLASGGLAGAEIDASLRAAAERYAGIREIAAAAVIVLALTAGALGLAWGRRTIGPNLPARRHVERAAQYLMLLASTVAVLTTVGIVLSLVFEAMRFFAKVPLSEFLFGLHWSPQTALRADQVGASGSFGAVPLFAGTLLITIIAMAVAVPVGLFSAIYLSEYAGPRLRSTVKPALEVLAGVPTVVYGFFAALSVAPLFRGIGESLGLSVASESALAAGVVMGVMIIPFVSSLSDDVMNAVPQTLRDGAYALGATKAETIKQVVLPAALPGIVGGLLLAISRAIGETMIVVMAAGLAANLTANPLQAVTTVTVQIVTLLVGDQEFDSPKTLAAFALGLVLFLATLVLNMIALHVVRRYRERYD